jgi:MFS family permease
MLFGLSGLLLGTVLIAASQGFYPLLAGMGLLGAGIGLLVPAVASGASLAVSAEEQGGAAGLVTACPAAGFVVGPVAAGFLYTVHPALAPAGAALVILIVLVLSLAAGRQSGRG